ncbi:MAG: ROK family transcriptional regulator [Bacilli bacterium]|nr:ROK family transcriptional regulator [Bacilli bacterium]
MNLNKTQKRIIELLLLKKTASKKELALEMNLSQAALTLASRTLLEEGYILSEGKKSNGKAGRSEELLSLNPDYGCFLGVDAKKSSLTLTEMNFAGELVMARQYVEDTDLLDHIAKEAMMKNVLGMSVTYRKRLEPSQHEGLVMKLEQFNIPHISFVNNVEALANVYHFLHEEDKNFLLVKYGPGLGSCIYVNGEPIIRKNGTRSEIGHGYLSNGSKIEDVVSFETLLGKDIDEKDGAFELFHDKEKLSSALSIIALTLLDADALLALDKIIFAGMLLTRNEVKEHLMKIILRYNEEFDTQKISPYPDYENLNRIKTTLQSYLDWLK